MHLPSQIRGVYYKHITIVNYDSSVVINFGASITDNARVVIYDRHMFIVDSTGVLPYFRPKQSFLDHSFTVKKSTVQCYKTFYGCNL